MCEKIEKKNQNNKNTKESNYDRKTRICSKFHPK